MTLWPQAPPAADMRPAGRPASLFEVTPCEGKQPMSAKPRRAAGVLAALTAVALAATACGGSSEPAGKDAKNITLTIAANAIAGGKNAAGAEWIEKWVIPRFVEAQKAKGVTAKVTFVPSGVDDEQYKTKLAAGPAVQGRRRRHRPSTASGSASSSRPATSSHSSEVAGDQVDSWEGWSQIPETVQGLGTFDDKRYGIPLGTDGRVLYYNKKLFAQAGLPADWQPKSWQEILDAGAKLKALPGVTPIQINAGTAMGEATTMQGALPLLVGAGGEIWKDGKWAGANQPVKDMLDFYTKVYGGGLGDPKLQQEAKGRDKSFEEFAAGKIGILGRGRLLLAQRRQPEGRHREDGRPGHHRRVRDDPGQAARRRHPRAGLRQHVRRRRATCSTRTRSTRPQACELLAFMHSAEAHQGRARRRGADHLADGRQQGGTRGRPDAELRRREGTAADRVPAAAGGLPAGVGGAAGGDRRRGVGQERRRGGLGVPEEGRRDRRWSR